MNKEISLTKASYSKRVFSFGLDLLIYIICSFLLMLPIQSLYYSSDSYKECVETMQVVEIESGLYKLQEGEYILVTNIDNPSTDAEYIQLNQEYDQLLTAFYSNPYFYDQSNPYSGMYIYNHKKIGENHISSQDDLFLYQDSSKTTIIENQNANPADLFAFYYDQIRYDAVNRIMQDEGYASAVKKINLTYAFLVIALPFVVMNIIVFYVIPLFNKRGYQSLGKKAFNLAICDSRGLSPTLGRFTIRYLLFLILELSLSVVSFALPLILSFSMFTFSKRSQSFHDYVANTYVVDVSRGRLARNLDEYNEMIKECESLDIKKTDVVFHK